MQSLIFFHISESKFSTKMSERGIFPLKNSFLNLLRDMNFRFLWTLSSDFNINIRVFFQK
jgi:hypothetical protein